MRVGLLTIATAKYDRFIKSLHGSAQTWFMKPTDHQVGPIVLTDSTIRPVLANYFRAQHLPWPYSTLRRYHMILEIRDWLLEHTDYLFYCDVDMRFVAPVGNEVLGDLVGTIHPGFYNKNREQFTYERRAQSCACIHLHEGERYYAGGFNGGKTELFLDMAEMLRSRIDDDLRKGIVAVWHDESYLNRYFVDCPPTIQLDPGYCYPESYDLPFQKRLLALDKNHEELRSVC